MSGNIYGWSSADVIKLRRLVASDKLFYSEIAEKLGKRPSSVRRKARQLGLPSRLARHRFAPWNRKHSHLSEKAMTYFLRHSKEETAAKFGLSEKEFKSLMTRGYQRPEYKHLRKEKRRHDPWTARELKFLLAHAGLMPRAWVAKKLKRGGHLGIKDRLDLLGISSMNLNGLTISKYRVLFGEDPNLYIQTKAGPQRFNPLRSSVTTPSYYKIVPWYFMENEIKARILEPHELFEKVIRSMAMFQHWIHDGDAGNGIKKIAKKCGLKIIKNKRPRKRHQ